MNSNLVPASIPAPPAGYGDFLLEIKAQIRQRQFEALRDQNCNRWLQKSPAKQISNATI